MLERCLLNSGDVIPTQRIPARTCPLITTSLSARHDSVVDAEAFKFTTGHGKSGSSVVRRISSERALSWNMMTSADGLRFKVAVVH